MHYTAFHEVPDMLVNFIGKRVRNQCSSINNRINSVNACYMHNLLSPHMQSQNVKIKICNTIIFPVVLYGRETCFHIKGRMRICLSNYHRTAGRV